MSNFFHEIWASVFQPGTNASLVAATHVSFALLQSTFIFLLVGTRSWHFVFLNLICGGLWAGITWFIREVAEMKKVELEAERLRKMRIEREKRENEDEKAWFAREVEEMRKMELAQRGDRNQGNNNGLGKAEEKKSR